MAQISDVVTPLVLEQADVVVIGITLPGELRNVVTLEDVPSADDSSEESPVTTAQPKQLWIFGPESEDAAEHCLSRLSEAGASGVRVASTEDALIAIAAHAILLLTVQRESQAQIARELVTLRRELNRALSALSADHPILGLLNTRPLAEHHAVPAAAMTVPFGADRNSASSIDAAELQRLHDAIAAMENTKVMRWSRAPRRIYSRLRSQRA